MPWRLPSRMASKYVSCAAITLSSTESQQDRIGDETRTHTEVDSYLPSLFNFAQSRQSGFPPVPYCLLCGGTSLPGPHFVLSW